MKGGARMPTKLIEAYDTKTGAKLPQRVPETWLDIFPTCL